ncbi:MAG TPA: hypothetical protein VF759_03620 [Allosphingosinicella sp.]|jgi:hypothetical protein
MKPLLPAFALIALSFAGPAASAREATVSVAGTWDLVWQTRKGPRREGRFVIVQQGTAIRGEIHGRGSVRAKGTATGSAFTLRGSKMAVPYTISGRVSGNRMEGTLKVMSVTRSFTGTRR